MKDKLRCSSRFPVASSPPPLLPSPPLLTLTSDERGSSQRTQRMRVVRLLPSKRIGDSGGSQLDIVSVKGV